MADTQHRPNVVVAASVVSNSLNALPGMVLPLSEAANSVPAQQPASALAAHAVPAESLSSPSTAGSAPGALCCVHARAQTLLLCTLYRHSAAPPCLSKTPPSIS